MPTTHKYYRSNSMKAGPARRGLALLDHSHPLAPSHPRPRGGYTLVELLVVVMIVLILIAAALPVAKSVMESNRTREASRQLNAHLAMARAYASRNNRPFGLWMEMDAAIGDATVRQITRIYLAEVQPPYSGGTTSSRGIIRREPDPNTDPFQFVPLTGVDVQPGPPDGRIDTDNAELGYLRALITEGEQFLVKFDFKGDWYRCQRGKVGDLNGYTDPLRFYYLGPVSSSVLPPSMGNNSSYGFRYQILRQPRRVGNPLELSGGTCIDLQYSGMGPTGYGVASNGGFKGTAGNRLIVLFSPGGAVDGLYVDSTPLTPTGTLHFLIGRVEKINPDVAGQALTIDNSNIADPNSYWVSVGRLNGSLTTAENYPDVEHANHSADPWGADRAEFIQECRALATGRELTGGQ
jgi:prepilin-type N-terminal cleavage/methylation domain-containing protein